MASILTHPAAAAAFAPWLLPRGRRKGILALGALCGVVPDVDALGFWAGVPYDSPLGHRGFTHALTFAALLAASLAALVPARRFGTSRLAVFSYLFLCTASHGFFDAMTDGGLGVAFFSPFSFRRFFLPFRPIVVSPIGILTFFTARSLSVLASELTFLVLPCALLALLGALVRPRREVRAASQD